MTFLLYLCKVFLGSGILLGYYWLFLRNKQFHRYNRFYLIGAFVLPVCLSFIRIGVAIEPQNAMDEAVYRTITVLTVNYGEMDGQVMNAAQTTDLFKIEYLLYIVYAAGMLALLVVLIKSILYVKRIARKYRHEVIGDMKFYNTTEPGTPFSFFKSVFWNERLGFNTHEGQQIFRHELFHVRQQHSTDILLVELMTALFWWNPFFHLAKKELKAIHEFLADEYAVSGSDRYSYAELLVLQTMQARHMAVTHRFFNNHIKRRIVMITHLKHAKNNYWSRLMALPIIVFLFCGVALYAQPNAVGSIRFDKSNEPIHVVIDAGHGGIDPGAQTADGSVKEKDLALQISQQIQALAPSYNVRVTMTRTGDELPASTINKTDGLRARTTIAGQAKADAFVSIHISSEDRNVIPTKSGFEIFIPSENPTAGEGSQQLGAALLQTISPFYTTNPKLLKRTEKTIWVLNHAPCPAVLIECGFLTSQEDVAFMRKDANQQAVARKILEGIVQFASQRAAAAMPVQDNDLVTEVSRHFNRNVRYPEKVRNANFTGKVYFSIDYNAAGKLENLKVYDEAPATTDPVHDLFIVGYAPKAQTNASPVPADEAQKLLESEVTKAFDKPVKFSEKVSKEPARLYFKASFRLEK